MTANGPLPRRGPGALGVAAGPRPVPAGRPRRKSAWRAACVAGLVGAGLAALAGPAAAIVNGQIVNQPRFLADYPWAVALENPFTGGVCSGALISPTVVLTAAHCTSSIKRVLVGNAARSRARVIDVAEAIRHPAWDRGTAQFDVGLLRLTRPAAAMPVRLIGRAEALIVLRPFAEGEILGWGKRPGENFSDRLVRGRVRLAQLLFNGTDLVFSSAAAPCGGDSGGPLLVRGLDGLPVLAGVASTTDGNLCAKGGGRASYVNLDALRDFIDQHVTDLPG